MSTFACFLVTGPEDLQLAEAQIIAKRFNVDLNKPSVDLFIIEPQSAQAFDKGGHVTIDQIRNLKGHLFQKPIAQSKKIVLIKRAHRLTVEAQNALLKILEEPPAHAIIILLATDKKSLLETIISRIITINTQGELAKDIKTAPLLTNDEFKLLAETAHIDDPNDWLNSQILSLYQALITNIKSDNLTNLEKLTQIIERCAATKKLIKANVNARFAIFNLIFSIS